MLVSLPPKIMSAKEMSLSSSDMVVVEVAEEVEFKWECDALDEGVEIES